jgi:hypothetical protein
MKIYDFFSWLWSQYKMIISKPFLIMILNAIYISPEKPKERNLGLKRNIYFL